jgi:hypothetical protein
MRPLANTEPNTAANTMYEWVVDTECDRHFIWSASSLETLAARVTEKGYRMKFVMELSEYEDMQDMEQRKMNEEIKKHVEGGNSAA